MYPAEEKRWYEMDEPFIWPDIKLVCFWYLLIFTLPVIYKYWGDPGSIFNLLVFVPFVASVAYHMGARRGWDKGVRKKKKHP